MKTIHHVPYGHHKSACGVDRPDTRTSSHEHVTCVRCKAHLKKHKKKK